MDAALTPERRDPPAPIGTFKRDENGRPTGAAAHYPELQARLFRSVGEDYWLQIPLDLAGRGPQSCR